MKKSILIAAAVLLLAASALAQAPHKAEDFTLRDMDGKAYSLSGYKGKVVLLNFWATWCKACVEEMPSLNTLAETMRGEPGFVMLSISQDTSERALKKYLAKNPLRFPVLMDPDKRVSFDLYAAAGVPVTVIVDKNGNMVKRHFGAADWASPESVAFIRKLLER